MKRAAKLAKKAKEYRHLLKTAALEDDEEMSEDDKSDNEYYGFVFDGIVPQLADTATFCWGSGGKERPPCPLQTSINLSLRLYSVYDCVVQGVNSPSTLSLMLLHQKPRLMLDHFRAVNAQILNALTLDPIHLIGTNLTFRVKYEGQNVQVPS